MFDSFAWSGYPAYRFGRLFAADRSVMRNVTVSVALFLIALALTTTHASAALPTDWEREQTFDLTATGLAKLSLPVETLDSSRPGLEDLRLYDAANDEVPYLIERSTPVATVVREAKSFQVALQPHSTVITLETGLSQSLDLVTLETPAGDFIKSVSIEGSADGSAWQTLAQDQPIFREPSGASRLEIPLPPGAHAWLRLVVDDQRAQPIPFTGARVHAAATEPAPGERLPVRISERLENPGESRLVLDLGAANLTVAAVQIETPEALFTRQITFAVSQVLQDSIREQSIGQGVVYRIGVPGQATVENLSMPLDGLVRSRELLLLVRNEDSPPLTITAVRIERRQVYLAFFARQAGTYHLLTGNSRCAAPQYDLTGLNMNLRSVPVATVKIRPPTDDPDFRPPEVLAGIEQTGATLDVSPWAFRRRVSVVRDGVQQLEFDPTVMSRAQQDFQDIRLMRSGRQVPYILEHTSISRTLTPIVTATNDSKDPRISRWIIKLSEPGIPISRLTCKPGTPLFEREMTLYETLADERGEKIVHTLGRAEWVQQPGRISRQLTLSLDTPPQTDTLVLETQNGDNPAMELGNFHVFHPVTRVLFKATTADEVFLYYGNAEIGPPSYDLSLVADQMLWARKTPATLGATEQLRKTPWREGQAAGSGSIVFWGILALVVVVLLVVISRLLPKQAQTGQ